MKLTASIKKSSFIFPGAGLLLMWLVACGETTALPPTATATVTATPAPAATSPAVSPVPTGSGLIFTATPSLPVFTATPVPALPVTAAPVSPASATAGPGLAPREQALRSARKLANEPGSFRYRLLQEGELVSTGSTTRLLARGEGAWQRPAFQQKVQLQAGGQQLQVEHFGQAAGLFQRVVETAIWRKQSAGVAGPFPDPARLEQATNFQATGKEIIEGEATTRLSWETPATGLLAGSGQAEGLGLLSATELYRPFAGDQAAVAQATLWVSEASGLPVRYRLTTTLRAAGTSLAYTTTYDYNSFNAAGITVLPPADLPK